MNQLTQTEHGMTVDSSGSFDETIGRVKAIFKEHGFGTLTEIDVAATLLEKTGETIEPYTILGMCNPQLASRALKVEHQIGLLLPCNVLVHECAGAVHVAAQDPTLMLEVTGNALLRPVAEEAKRRILEALQEVGK